MRRLLQHAAMAAGLLASPLLFPSTATAAKPSVEQALKLTPLQPDVDYEVPTKEQLASCNITPETKAGVSGWFVSGEHGQPLRRFLDTDGDNKVDQWCYYKNGIEVYRDIDANFNGKADQYRWLGTAGSRWGLDADEDGRIDSWKQISAEEVTAEVVAALRDRDANRFHRLLLTRAELEKLGLGPQQAQGLEKRIAAAADTFAELARRQQLVTSRSQWVNFGATQPGVLPAGTDGSTKDVLLYDNTAAIVETEGKHGQVIVGTLVRVGEGWRVIDLPKNLGDDDPSQPSTGFFFASVVSRPNVELPPGTGLNEEMQKLLSELERVDKAIDTETRPASLAKLHGERADILDRLASGTANDKERESWIHQFADMVSAAAQSGDFPDGVTRLKTMLDRLSSDDRSKDLAGYVKFRYMTAEYGQSLQKPNADFAKIQQQWLKDLEAFINDYPPGDDTAEAMLQLAIAQEFAGGETEAAAWYGRIVSDFPDRELAKKAAGAKRRLESVGKTIPLRSKTLDGKTADLAGYRGHVVLVHYWATWCEPCKEDMKTIKSLQAKYGTRGFAPIGVNLDSDRQLAESYLASNRLPWPQLYEPGGLDSPLASELGIFTLPTMILVDKTGRVVRRNIHVGELEEEIGRLTK